jgi:hypothetical protein
MAFYLLYQKSLKLLFCPQVATQLGSVAFGKVLTFFEMVSSKLSNAYGVGSL